MPTDLTQDQRMAVSCAVRRALRYRHPSIGFDDLYQIGAEAVLRAVVNEEMEPPQRHVYREMRARGAMLDAVRSAYRQGRMVSDDPQETDAPEIETEEPDLGASPERMAAVHAACTRIERMPAPCPTVAAMAADGADCEEIAAALGVTVSRVSQHRAAIRKVLERHL